MQLNLVRGHSAEAITQLEFYQDTLYKGASTEELTQLVQRIFQETPLAPPQLAIVFEVMQASALRSVIRAYAYLGVLLKFNWSSEVGFAVQALTSLLATDASLITTLGVQYALRLTQANAERRDAVNTLRLASALVENALILGESGAALTEQLYSLINWGPEMAASALETLRTYVRRAPFQYARAAAERMGRQYGPPMAKALDATVRMRLILGGGDLVALSDQLDNGVQLLTDMAVTYHESSDIPAIHKLRQQVEALPGSLNDSERERLADNCFRLADQLLVLARLRSRDDARPNVTALLIQGSAAPASGVDALRWLGGHFAGRRALPFVLEHSASSALFGNRSTNTLLRDLDSLIGLFDRLLSAFAENTPPPDNAAFRAEVESLWSQTATYVQRRIVTRLAENAQALAELIVLIGERGSDRSLANSGYGRQLATGRIQPRSVIDALRWVNGYFAGQHSG